MRLAHPAGTWRMGALLIVIALSGCYIGDGPWPNEWNDDFGYARIEAIPVAGIWGGLEGVGVGHGFAVSGVPAQLPLATVSYPILVLDPRQSLSDAHNECVHSMVHSGERLTSRPHAPDFYLACRFEQTEHPSTSFGPVVRWSAFSFGVGFASPPEVYCRRSVEFGGLLGTLWTKQGFGEWFPWDLVPVEGGFIRGGIEFPLHGRGGGSCRPHTLGAFATLESFHLHGFDHVFVGLLSTALTLYW